MTDEEKIVNIKVLLRMVENCPLTASWAYTSLSPVRSYSTGNTILSVVFLKM